MLRLLLVKSRNSLFRRGSDLAGAAADVDDKLNHGTQVLKYLVQPWARTNRVVYADSSLTRSYHRSSSEEKESGSGTTMMETTQQWIQICLLLVG